MCPLGNSDPVISRINMGILLPVASNCKICIIYTAYVLFILQTGHMTSISTVVSSFDMAELLAMISKWWICIIDSACALYILKKSRINIVRLFWIRAQSYVGILKMYCTFVFGLCIINPVTSMDHSTFEKCTCIINPACPFCHLHHFWRNLVPPVLWKLFGAAAISA